MVCADFQLCSLRGMWLRLSGTCSREQQRRIVLLHFDVSGYEREIVQFRTRLSAIRVCRRSLVAADRGVDHGDR